MLIVPCLECFTAVRVLGEPDRVNALVGENSDFWPDHYTCVSCGRGCEGILEIEATADALSRLKVRELTAEEYFAALMGLGTPDEMVCDGATVRELLQIPIKKVVGQDIRGTTRFCLTELELENGIRLFFGASAHGAIVYRIARPISYTQRVLEETP
jgi:hypothetical protein